MLGLRYARPSGSSSVDPAGANGMAGPQQGRTEAFTPRAIESDILERLVKEARKSRIVLKPVLRFSPLSGPCLDGAAQPAGAGTVVGRRHVEEAHLAPLGDTRQRSGDRAPRPHWYTSGWYRQSCAI